MNKLPRWSYCFRFRIILQFCTPNGLLYCDLLVRYTRFASSFLVKFWRKREPRASPNHDTTLVRGLTFPPVSWLPEIIHSWEYRYLPRPTTFSLTCVMTLFLIVAIWRCLCLSERFRSSRNNVYPKTIHSIHVWDLVGDTSTVINQSDNDSASIRWTRFDSWDYTYTF